MAYNDEQDDLDRYLASQQAPNLDPTPSAAGAQEQQPGTWARAAQMLGGQGRNSAPDPAPKQSGLDSWSTILGMLASKDPGSVLAQDAAGRRQAVDAWQRRQASRDDAAFGRQAQAAGLLMHEDAAKRAQASEQFNQDRATANDISAAANTDWQRQHTEGRDQVSDQHWSAGNDLAQTGQDATIENMQAQRALQERGLTQADAHFGQSQAGMDRRNTEDNARALQAAQIGASVKTEAQQALAASRADAASAKKDALDQREYNDYRNGKHVQLFDLAQKIKGIEDVWARHPVDDRPGAGVFDGSDSKWLHPFGAGQSDDDMAVRTNFKALQEYLQNKVTGASAPKDQAARIAAIAGAQSGATEQQASVSLNTMRDDIRAQLRGLGSGREPAARKVLGDMGLSDWVYGKDPTPAQAAAEVPQAAPPPAAGPSGTTQLQNIQDQATATGKLSDTGGRRDAPPIPQDAVAGPKPRNVIKPDGSRVVYPLTDERFQLLMSKPGWSSY